MVAYLKNLRVSRVPIKSLISSASECHKFISTYQETRSVCLSYKTILWRSAEIVTEDDGSHPTYYNLHPTPTSSPTNLKPTHAPPSPQPPTPQPSPPQPSPTHLGLEYHPPSPHDSPLHAVHSHGSDEGSLKLQELMTLVTILSDRGSKKHSRFVLSDAEDDSSKQGRKFSQEGFKDGEGVQLLAQEKRILRVKKFLQLVTRKLDYTFSTNVLGERLLTQEGVKKRKEKGKEQMHAEQRAQILEMQRLARQGMKKKGKELWMKLRLQRRLD
ncbi:hypothetical protein Tco_0005574 [Tanacetum coccineum]